MSKRNIPFTIIETAVVRSEQLTWTEKRFYIALKTYRRNSPPTRCNPSLKTIQKSSGLSYPYLKKAKKLLEMKGLIKYEPGGGRTKTNKYIFTLEEGTNEEKQRLLAYLRAKKTGNKLTHFKTKKEGRKEPILRQKTGLKNTKKQGRKEPTNKKYLTREQQQQEKTKKPDVVASFSHEKGKNSKPVVKNNNRTANLIVKLKELGITEDKARELLATHLYENVEKQVEWLPYRTSITNPAGALIRAVEQNWPEPVTTGKGAPREWKESLKFKRVYAGYWESQKVMLKIAKEDLKKGASPGRVKEWLDKLDPDCHKELKDFVKELNNDSKTKRGR